MNRKKIAFVLVLCAIVYNVAGWVGNLIEDYLTQKYIIPEAYLSEVKTTYYPKEWVIAVFTEFNDMADGQTAVLFEKHEIDRKITIEDNSYIEIVPFFLKDPDGPTTIGRTIENPLNCRILLKTGMHYASFRTTLLHEYLHCIGFDHVDKQNDLMAPSENESTKIPDENIKEYAKKAAKKIWKNTKN